MTKRSFSSILGLALIFALAVGLAAPAAGWAKAGATSGGYSRPAAANSSRTPSTRPFSAPRRPSTSGGYSRPGTSSSSAPTAFQGSETDRALSRQSSKQALETFRARTLPTTDPMQEQAPRRPSTAPGGTFGDARQPADRNAATAWLDGGQARAVAAHQSPSQFGPWSAALLWGLLESLSRPGHAAFFYHHADDPGLRQWRAEAETQARDNPELKPLLDKLDAQVAEMTGPRDPTYPPPAVASPSFPFAALMTALLLLVAGALILAVIWRRFYGDVARGNPGMFASSARQPYRPKWFRVGMTLPVDPSLFILAAPYTAIQAPEAATASGFLSVESLGEAVCEGLTWYRLYVSGGRGFFQVHLDQQGHPDECRYFSRLDEVIPADAEEWSVWLDAREGMIGWPEFQTRDGRVYQRLWAPGQARVAPRTLSETLETTGGGTQQRRQQTMLYARATGVAAPATDYLLVSAVEQDATAWVAIHAGIDIPIGALQLS
jgi:hypothetical protein